MSYSSETKPRKSKSSSSGRRNNSHSQTNGETVPSNKSSSNHNSEQPLLQVPDTAPFTTLHHITSSYPIVSDSLSLLATTASTYAPLLPQPLVTTATTALQTASTVTTTLAPHVPLAARVDSLALALVSRLDPLLTTPTPELARHLDPVLKPVNDRLVVHVVDKLIPPQTDQTGTKSWADAAKENVTLRQRRMGAGDAGGGGVDVHELPSGDEGEVAYASRDGGAPEGRDETQVERLVRIGAAVGGWVVGETRRREESRGVGVVRGGIGAVGAAVEKVVRG